MARSLVETACSFHVESEAIRKKIEEGHEKGRSDRSAQNCSATACAFLGGPVTSAFEPLAAPCSRRARRHYGRQMRRVSFRCHHAEDTSRAIRCLQRRARARTIRFLLDVSTQPQEELGHGEQIHGPVGDPQRPVVAEE
jgi:hypothetical protein